MRTLEYADRVVSLKGSSSPEDDAEQVKNSHVKYLLDDCGSFSSCIISCNIWSPGVNI